VVASLANWSIENVDSFMVGRAYGTTMLGDYAIAYNLVRTPANHIVFSLQQVIQPFTAQQDDPQMMRRIYLTLLWVVTLVTMPAFFGLGVAPTAIDALYGSEWSDAIPVLLPLALAMPLQAVVAIGGPVLWGSGRVGREIGVSFPVLILLIVVLAAASRISVVAMAWGVWLVYLVRAVWITSVSAILGLPLLRSLSMLRGGLLVGALTSAVLYAADSLMTQVGMTPVYRLGVAVVLGAILVPLVATLLMRVILPTELGDVLRQVLGRFPVRVQAWLSRRFAV
jgi:O-antigen/teichoic acid export membrane protein